MNARTLMVGAVLVPALLGLSPQERGAAARSTRDLWIFMSTAETDLRPDLREIARLRKQGLRFRLRPCLLIEDFRGLKKAKEAQVENVKAMRDLVGEGFGLPIMDEEGLALARELRIERVPAFVLVDAGARRAHVVYGHGAKISEILSCE